MNVLIIKDNKPGHYNQTEGLLLQLKELYENVEVEYIEVEIRSKFSRKLLRILLNKVASFFYKKNSFKWLNFFYKKYSIPIKKPHLIISTGGNTSNFNAWLAKAYKCKNILNGALRGLKEENFTYITTVIDLGYKNQIILDVAPSLVTQEKIEIESNNFLNKKHLDKNKKYYSLLIGGNGSGYSFDDEFFDKLIDFVKDISKKDNVSWLITTSRRTESIIEKRLQKELKAVSSYFVAYNQKEEKVLSAFLGLSDKVFVTEDSASMISEAISSKKMVFTLRPKKFNVNINYKRLLEKFELASLINICHMSNNFNISNNNFNIKKIKNIFHKMEL